MMTTTQEKKLSYVIYSSTEYERSLTNKFTAFLKAHKPISSPALGYSEKFSVRFDGSSGQTLQWGKPFVNHSNTPRLQTQVKKKITAEAELTVCFQPVNPNDKMANGSCKRSL